MVRNLVRRVDGTKRPICAIIQIPVLPGGVFSFVSSIFPQGNRDNAELLGMWKNCQQL
jgi:hypothetical protein